jgi:hypothetical protein
VRLRLVIVVGLRDLEGELKVGKRRKKVVILVRRVKREERYEKDGGYDEGRETRRFSCVQSI